MMTRLSVPTLLLAALAIAGCSPTAKNEAGQAADAISADINATASEATADTANALDAAGASIDNGATAAGAAAGNAADAAGAELDRAGGALSNGANAVDNSM